MRLRRSAIARAATFIGLLLVANVRVARADEPPPKDPPPKESPPSLADRDLDVPTTVSITGVRVSSPPRDR